MSSSSPPTVGPAAVDPPAEQPGDLHVEQPGDPPVEPPRRRRAARARPKERLAYRIPEVAAMLGIGESTAYELVNEGILPTVTIVRPGKNNINIRLVPADALHQMFKLPKGGRANPEAK